MDQNHSISAHGFDSPAGHASMVPRADRRVPRYTWTAAMPPTWSGSWPWPRTSTRSFGRTLKGPVGRLGLNDC